MLGSQLIVLGTECSILLVDTPFSPLILISSSVFFFIAISFCEDWGCNGGYLMLIPLISACGATSVGCGVVVVSIHYM